MAHKALAVANYLIDHAAAQNARMSPMKLQKLVCYANGWYLTIRDQPLINEQVEAWPYGPVIRSLYHDFRHYGNQDIASKGTEERRIRRPNRATVWGVVTPVLSKEDPDGEFAMALLDKIWDVYGKYSAIQLSNKTHEEGSPWKQIYDQYHGKLLKGTDIPTDLIKKFFDQLAQSETPL